ncbi:MAG: hypothetical protein HGA71_14560 [Azonexaceae bacterium]|nr:hypothetical protein [Azonexaceae bacterium]
MSNNKDIKECWDAGLTHEECWIIGDIVAQWGALEAGVFSQALESFGSDIHVNQLPRAMRNRNFSEVLELWKERVVDTAEDTRKKILTESYEIILELKEARNSIVHGMWDFTVSEPKVISTFRVKDDQIIHTKFEDGALADIGTRIAELNLKIRYPGGIRELFMEQMSAGVYVNHAAMRRMKLQLEREQNEKA